MLAIRLQRTGRKGHAQFRVVVQDSRRTPSSGRVVALLGSFNPHTKTTTIDKEKAEFYLKNGAQPSERVVRLFKAEGIKLPSWVKLPANKERTTRNIEKLRKNRPAEVASEEAPAESVDEASATEEAPAEEAPVSEAMEDAAESDTTKDATEETKEVSEA